ncbi:MAG TPA: glucosaminidase domain-containing protein [Ktedonobacteraceae bacterium]|nr:glucosaminidase domain-containing protein [Ktedonobacteraceae bacterium]
MFNRLLTALFLIVMLAAILLAYRASAFHITPLTSEAANAAPALVANASGCYCVTGKPTVSATFINQVLAFYHSPARGLGATIYALGVKYGINPVYALAFFMHESRFGTLGVARSTLSPGNLRCAPGFPCINGYRAYSSWAQGFAGWYSLIRNLYVNQWHKTTIEQIIPTYAPAGDGNNPATYMTAVENAVSSWQAGKVEVM